VFGVSRTTVYRWMKRHDIKSRTTGRGPAYFHTNNFGYEYWQCTVMGEKEAVPVHRLLMVAEHGFHAVAEADVVHHRNEIPFDNRPKNLELMGKGEHQRHHIDGEYCGTPWRDEEKLYEEFIQQGKTMQEVADEWDTSDSVVYRWIRRHNIRPWRDEGYLNDEYVKKGRSTVEIADELDVSSNTIRRYLHNFDIPVREPGERQ